MVVGPPGTGKTDTAVQILNVLYHNCPSQRTLIITHSNQALNDLFEKIMQVWMLMIFIFNFFFNFPPFYAYALFYYCKILIHPPFDSIIEGCSCSVSPPLGSRRARVGYRFRFQLSRSCQCYACPAIRIAWRSGTPSHVP